MTDPSSRHEIGGVQDYMANDSLRHVRLAFSHHAKAVDLEAGLQPISPTEVQLMFMCGPFAFAAPVFGKTIFNCGRRALAALHRSEAQRILPEPLR